MQKRIAVPVWLVALHLVVLAGLVVMLIIPAFQPIHRVVTVVEVRVTATPEPTETPTITPTATQTVVPPTATMAPTTVIGTPVSQTVTSEGVVLDTSGIKHVEVISKERRGTFTDSQGQSYPPPTPAEEFLLVTLRLPDATTRADIMPWFGNNDTPLPAVVDEHGYQTDWKFATPGEKNGHKLLTLVFLVRKASAKETLIFPDGARVDLSLVPDVTTVQATPPVADGHVPTATPRPSPTSLIHP